MTSSKKTLPKTRQQIPGKMVSTDFTPAVYFTPYFTRTSVRACVFYGPPHDVETSLSSAPPPSPLVAFSRTTVYSITCRRRSVIRNICFLVCFFSSYYCYYFFFLRFFHLRPIVRTRAHNTRPAARPSHPARARATIVRAAQGRPPPTDRSSRDLFRGWKKKTVAVHNRLIDDNPSAQCLNHNTMYVPIVIKLLYFGSRRARYVLYIVYVMSAIITRRARNPFSAIQTLSSHSIRRFFIIIFYLLRPSLPVIRPFCGRTCGIPAAKSARRVSSSSSRFGKRQQISNM